MTATATRTTCRRCHRALHTASSIAAGYGPTCIKRVAADTADFSIDQTVKAVAHIADGDIRKLRGGTDALFQVRSGFRTYWTSYTDCTCDGARKYAACHHIESVRILARQQTAGRRYATAA